MLALGAPGSLVGSGVSHLESAMRCDESDAGSTRAGGVPQSPHEAVGRPNTAPRATPSEVLTAARELGENG